MPGEHFESGSATAVDGETLAKNFSQFLTLLTTQPKNQNTLDPLDTNQFTQQLVQFAQVEQQLKQNDQLATLVSQQKIAQSTAVLGFVGETVVVDVDGSTASLANGQANWTLMSRSGTFAVIFCLFLAAVWACGAKIPSKFLRS